MTTLITQRPPTNFLTNLNGRQSIPSLIGGNPQPVMPDSIRHLATPQHSLNALTFNSEEDRYEINADKIKKAYQKYSEKNTDDISKVHAHALLREKGVICFEDVCRLRQEAVDYLLNVDEVDWKDLVGKLILPPEYKDSERGDLQQLIDYTNSHNRGYELLLLLGILYPHSEKMMCLYSLLVQAKPQLLYDIDFSSLLQRWLSHDILLLGTLYPTAKEQLEFILGKTISGYESKLHDDVTLIVCGRKVAFRKDTNLWFYRNGELKSGVPLDDAELPIGGRNVKFKSGPSIRIRFHSNGAVNGGCLLENAEFLLQGKTVQMHAGELIELSENGEILRVNFHRDVTLKVQGEDYHFKERDWARFYPDGAIKQLWIANDKKRKAEFQVRGNLVKFKHATDVIFYPDGKVKMGFLREQAEFLTFEGKRVTVKNGVVGFDENGFLIKWNKNS